MNDTPASEEIKEISKIIQSMDGGHGPVTVFNDFVTMSALAIQNGCTLMGSKIWQQREEQYQQIIGKYDEKARETFPELFARLALAIENNPSDVLGSIFMEIGASYGGLGQFFTPFHLSKLCAALANPEPENDTGCITITEPSCGGGGMIIAAALHLRDKGIDYQRRLRVVAQDLDWQAVYMCYVQLSLMGIRATVVQGSTLTEPYVEGRTDSAHVFRTPAEMGVLI